MTKPQTYTGYCPRADGEAFVSAVLATRRADAAKQSAPLETTANLQSTNSAARTVQEEPICLDIEPEVPTPQSAGCLACQGRHRSHSCGKLPTSKPKSVIATFTPFSTSEGLGLSVNPPLRGAYLSLAWFG